MRPEAAATVLATAERLSQEAHENAAPRAAHRLTARRVFLGALVFTSLITLVWLWFVVTQRDGGLFFRRYNVDLETIQRLVGGFLVFWVGWGWLWYRFKRFLLRRAAGFSPEELASVFGSRLGSPGFDLATLLDRHSERRIRIIDMIGRRGRTVPAAMAVFFFLYGHISKNPHPESLALGIQDNFIDAIAFSWFNLLAYYSNGPVGRLVYGAHARVMDGMPARANVLLIAMLWNAFKFVMIPIGLRLGALFPPNTYAALFVFIWISYLTSDALSEVVGSLWGRQRLRVWGLGEVNRKSLAGTWACFASSLAVCLWIVWVHQLPPPWLGLAVVISISNTLFELLSPRGSDDFTMATANALLCWAFGALLYSPAA